MIVHLLALLGLRAHMGRHTGTMQGSVPVFSCLDGVRVKGNGQELSPLWSSPLPRSQMSSFTLTHPAALVNRDSQPQRLEQFPTGKWVRKALLETELILEVGPERRAGLYWVEKMEEVFSAGGMFEGERV